ncbi:MAG: hypothetical protein ABIK62_07965 [candidate division WOR-3 bacterium]
MVSFAALLVLVANGFGYGLRFTCRGDTVQRVLPGHEATFRFLLQNTGNEADAYLVGCRVLGHISGWFEIFCVRGGCHEPGEVVVDCLQPSAADSTITLTVYTSSAIGE